MEEMKLRHGPYPAGFERFLKDRELVTSLDREKWKFTGSLHMPPELTRPYVIKYGERQYLEPMLRHGRIRISPASKYNDASLNRAIRDDELRAELDVNDFGMSGTGGALESLLFRFSKRRKITKQLNTNYYVYCMSRRFATRLAHDFGGDCCVVIRDPGAFAERLETAFKAQFPSWHAQRAQVEYYDPLMVNVNEVQVLTWKHFRFAYQEEDRIAWVPPIATKILDAVDVEIGSIEDIASIVVP
jgi:hypothetical protein